MYTYYCFLFSVHETIVKPSYMYLVTIGIILVYTYTTTFNNTLKFESTVDKLAKIFKNRHNFLWNSPIRQIHTQYARFKCSNYWHIPVVSYKWVWLVKYVMIFSSVMDFCDVRKRRKMHTIITRCQPMWKPFSNTFTV